MRVPNNRRAEPARQVSRLGPVDRSSGVLGALEAENAHLRDTVADLALETALLRERLADA
jgi:hypothetical protein